MNKLLVYVGRYGKQPIADFQDRITTEEAVEWMELIDEMIRAEKPDNQ